MNIIKSKLRSRLIDENLESCLKLKTTRKPDLETLRHAPPPLELENARQFEVTTELRTLQAKMAALFLHQQRRGGIIDVEAEESKLLVLTDSQDDSPIPADEQRDSPPGPSLPQQQPAPAPPRSQAPRSYRGFPRHPRTNKGRNYRPSAPTR